jgi:Flp pilus assembly protein TadG
MFLNRLRRDRRGAAAVEFALIAPILVLIYMALVELCEAMLAERKVEHAASAVGDLVAQGTATSQAAIGQYYDAAGLIVGPFSTNPLQMRVSSVKTDASGNATVDWGNATSNSTALCKGTSVTLPKNLIGPNQSVIMSEAIYTYSSPLNYFIKNALTFDQVFYLAPRQSTSVTCPDCC